MHVAVLLWTLFQPSDRIWEPSKGYNLIMVYMVGVDCGGSTAPVKSFRGTSTMIGYGMGIFTGTGLRYGQGFSSGQLQAWMQPYTMVIVGSQKEKNDMVAYKATLFC